MKKIIGLSIVLPIMALGTHALAAAFTPGNLVVYRVGGDASGNTADTLVNTGNIVWIDEYSTDGVTRVQSIPMPIGYYGANSPLVSPGSNFGNGLITRSADGRFILVTGFGATTNQFSFGLQSAFGTEAPRVIGLVDGNGHIDTTTVQTNTAVDGVELRSATSTDGTNLWFGGSANGARYAQRTNLWFSGIGTSTNLPSVGNIRQINLFNGQLFFSSSSTPTNYVSFITNNVPGQIPTDSNNVVQVSLPGVTNSIPFFTSPWAFTMFKLKTGGADPLDTIYVADAGTNTASGSIRKFSFDGTTWQNSGSIRCSGAVGLTAQLRISGATTNVDLWIVSNVDAATGNDTIHFATDATGYNGAASGNANSTILATSSTEVSWRGIAFAPVGGETFPSGPPALSAGPLLDFFSVGSTGCSATETDTYSIANFGTSAMNWTATCPSNWVAFSSGGSTLGAGGSITVSAFFNPTFVTGLPSGTNTAVITFSNNSGGLGTQTRNVQLVMKPQSISPNPATSDYTPTGQPGGPTWSPSNKVYTVFNGTGSLNLIITNTYAPAGTAWLTYSLTNFPSMPGCSSTDITFSVNAAANSLAAGNYASTVTFSNAAGSVIGTLIVNLTVGGAFFCDDFSTYNSGTLAGQKGWVNNGQGNFNEPTITSGVAWLPAVTGAFGGDEPYKNLPQMPSSDPVTSNGSFSVFAGMLMTVTSAPPSSTASPARVMCFYQGQNPTTGQVAPFNVDAIGVKAYDAGNTQYVFGVRTVSTGAHPFVFGTNVYNFGQAYRVILQGEVGNTNCYLYVDPASPTLNTSTAIAKDHDTTGFQLDPGIGSFGICNTFGSGGGGSPIIAGIGFSKICIATDYTEVYNDIQPASAPTADFTGTPVSGVEPLQVVFTDASSGSPTSWAWDFDNNGSTDSTAQNPTNIYAAGTYTVRLIACNGGGCTTNTKIAYISVITALQSWQNFYGVTANGSDSDLDGMSNTNEFLAGFKPNNNAAYLHIINVAKSGTNIVVTYLGASGDNSYTGGPTSRTNVLEFTLGTGNGSYTSTNFVPIGAGGTNVLTGGSGLGTVTSFVDTNGASGATKYYRVRVLVP